MPEAVAGYIEGKGLNAGLIYKIHRVSMKNYIDVAMSTKSDAMKKIAERWERTECRPITLQRFGESADKSVNLRPNTEPL